VRLETFHSPPTSLGRELERFSLGVLERLSRLLRLASSLGAEAPIQSYPEFIGNVRLESMSLASVSLSVAGSVLAHPPLTAEEAAAPGAPHKLAELRVCIIDPHSAVGR